MAAIRGIGTGRIVCVLLLKDKVVEIRIINIRTRGEGKRTWTGMSFQVADVIAGAAEIVAAGGQLSALSHAGRTHQKHDEGYN